jgi:ADP-ribose pyrophosphatase YjhB (NUDIX family)
MYKIFIENRQVILTNTIPDIANLESSLFYKYTFKKELSLLIDSFHNQLHNISSLYVYYRDIDKLFDVFQSLFTMIYAGGGIVVSENNELLIIKRRGKWDLPKGKAEGDESIEQTAIREVEEECHISNLEIERKLPVTYHIYKMKTTSVLKATYWYKMNYTGSDAPKPQEEEDITAVKWFSKEKLENVFENTYASVAQLIKESLPVL